MADPLLIQRAVARVAEERIAAAQRAGAFDTLPGAGRPIPGIDDPANDLWWLRKYLRRERVAPGQLLRELSHIVRQRNAGISCQ